MLSPLYKAIPQEFLKHQKSRKPLIISKQDLKRLLQHEKRTWPRLPTLIDPRFKKDGFLFAFNAVQSAIALDN